MNPATIAAIIKKYGTRLAGGEYEIFVSLADVRTIPPGSGMREYQDLQRNGFVLRLFQRPQVIDITATVTDLEGNPIVKVPPAPPPEPPPAPEPLSKDPLFQTFIDSAPSASTPPQA